MIVSLNEVAATATKAVRGGGHPEGLAKDMGFAARWLCQRELPGVSVLLAALDMVDAGGVSTRATIERHEAGCRLEAVGGAPLAALRVAPSLTELAVVEAGGPSTPSWLSLESLCQPLLLVPFVDRSRPSGVSVRWSAGDGSVVVEPSDNGIQIRAAHRSALGQSRADEVIVGTGPNHDLPPVVISAAEFESASQRSIANGCSVDSADWERLGQLAWRTYVPVSEESRLRGAGAGLTDND